jgi:hypothetical protein
MEPDSGVTMSDTSTGEQPDRERESFFATKPTAFTRFMRTFIPWQIVRFAVLNLKMMRIIARSHRG